MFHKLLSIVRNGGKADTLTVIDCNPAEPDLVGKMIVVDEDGQAAGQVETGVIEEILAALRKTEWIQPTVLSVEGKQGTIYRLFWDRVVKKPCAIVFGGGHVSQPLVQMLALVDFEVTVIDDRPEFANKARFPGAQQVICQSFQSAVKDLAIDQDTAVIIVTRGHRYDLDCLRATMGSNARYLGMIGSRKRIRECLSLLKEEGAPAALEQRLRAPIGLNIKAETPAEIALSIAAEVVAVFRGASNYGMCG
ncbi:XdhC family protein [Sporomusa acidovorans]|uniref:XdhC Rossmann domain-containing protein n=1 Tax=Sporomusa acidovorans (strain ATCC 49682 / DSM 3132 / Mol) TaxID=1123286 RepID=A0ABZ3J0K5_SPOA4|nr:XdhC family protein [Sporomusa acidovorans]OZC22287.1 putative xanthine dehydrogenase subunit A [Sporomusa acidovorans DSM 3132]SDF35779.1 xanthine dehydrogenase accessory factor [Sporomusa acidovorans]